MAVVYGLFGAYYEVSDDTAIMLLIKGEHEARPIYDINIYFFGIAAILGWLYRVAPGMPWYALALYVSLYGALVQALLLIRASTAGHRGWFWALAAVFSILFFTNHLLAVSFTRSPILVGASTLLLLARYGGVWRQHRAQVMLHAVFFVLAVCIRPMAGLLGCLCALPAAVAYAYRFGGGWPRLRQVVLYVVATAGVMLLSQYADRSEDHRRFEAVNLLKSALLDFNSAEFVTHTPADQARAAAVANWIVYDEGQIDEAFYHRSLQFAPLQTLLHRLPAKIQEVVVFLKAQYIKQLLAMLVLLLLIRTRFQWFTLLVTAGLFAGLMGELLLFQKLPPRLLLPMLTVALLVIVFVAFFRPPPALPRRVSQAAGLVLALLLAKTLLSTYQQTRSQRSLQRAGEENTAYVAQYFAKQIVVRDHNFSHLTAHRDPFDEFTMKPAHSVSVSGWFMPHWAAQDHWQQLAGVGSFGKAVPLLAARPGVVWLMTPKFKEALCRYFEVVYGVRLPLGPARSLAMPAPLPALLGKQLTYYTTETAPAALPSSAK